MDGGMIKSRLYPDHKCLQCGHMTKMKTYCAPCLKIIKVPQFVFQKRDMVAFAETVGKCPTRRENINSMR